MGLHIVAVFMLLVLASAYAQLQKDDGLQQWTIIDDADPSITYLSEGTMSPPSRWDRIIASDPLSRTCYDRIPCRSTLIDASKTYGGTWHEANGPANASLTFTGVALEVYFIVWNAANSSTEVSFFIDDALVGRLVYAGNATSQSEEWIYNSQVARLSGWSTDKPHRFTMQQTNPASTIVFDYLRYSRASIGDKPSTRPHSMTLPTQTLGTSLSSNEHAKCSSAQWIPILAVSICAMGILSIAAVLLLFIHNRRMYNRKLADHEFDPPNPYVVPQPPFQASTSSLASISSTAPLQPQRHADSYPRSTTPIIIVNDDPEPVEPESTGGQPQTTTQLVGLARPDEPAQTENEQSNNGVASLKEKQRRPTLNVANRLSVGSMGETPLSPPPTYLYGQNV